MHQRGLTQNVSQVGVGGGGGGGGGGGRLGGEGRAEHEIPDGWNNYILLILLAKLNTCPRKTTALSVDSKNMKWNDLLYLKVCGSTTTMDCIEKTWTFSLQKNSKVGTAPPK